ALAGELIQRQRQPPREGACHRHRLLAFLLRSCPGEDERELGLLLAIDLADVDHADTQGRAQDAAVVGREGRSDEQGGQQGLPGQRLPVARPRRRSSSSMASWMLYPCARSSSSGALSSSLLENSRCVAGSRMLRATPSPTGEEMYTSENTPG